MINFNDQVRHGAVDGGAAVPTADPGVKWAKYRRTTGDLYEWNGSDWVLIEGPNASTGTVTVGDTTLSIDSLPLPAGAATSAKQDTLDTDLKARLAVLGQGTAAASAPVVLASDTVLPLPTGAATSAKQDTLDTDLKARLAVLGQAAMAASAPVVIASNQSAVPVTDTALEAVAGTTAGAGVVTDTGGTLQQYLRGLVKLFADVWDSTLHALGTKLLGAPRSTGVITLNAKNATGTDATLDVSAYGTALLNVSSNAGSTVQFEGSADGTTWLAIGGHQRGAGVFSSTTASTGVWVFDVAAFSLFRANITAAAGAVTATAYGTAAPRTPTLIATAPQGYTTGRVTITRPSNATPYSANDVVGATAAAITLPTIGPTGGGEVMITRTMLEIDVAAVPAGMSFTLELYSVTPPSALADNAAWDLGTVDRASHLASIGPFTPVDRGSTLKVETDSINKQITVPSGGTLYGYLVTPVGFTPAGNSEVYVLTVKSVAL